MIFKIQLNKIEMFKQFHLYPNIFSVGILGLMLVPGVTKNLVAKGILRWHDGSPNLWLTTLLPCGRSGKGPAMDFGPL